MFNLFSWNYLWCLALAKTLRSILNFIEQLLRKSLCHYSAVGMSGIYNTCKSVWMRLNFKLLKYVVSTLNLCNKDVSFDFYLSHDMIRVLWRLNFQMKCNEWVGPNPKVHLIDSTDQERGLSFNSCVSFLEQPCQCHGGAILVLTSLAHITWQ